MTVLLPFGVQKAGPATRANADGRRIRAYSNKRPAARQVRDRFVVIPWRYARRY
jgi:hypothetical protein